MTEGAHELQWFGSAWGAPVNQISPHAPTPVGEQCSRCDEPVLLGDRGVLMWHIAVDQCGYRPQHAECYVRSAVGGIDHLLHHGLGVCQGECLPDPGWLTRREAAEFVSRMLAYYQQRVRRSDV